MTGPGYPKELLVFYDRIYKLVDDPSTDSIISWSKTNKSFIIWNLEEFIRKKFLSRFFSDTFTEFVSWLEFYGFREIKGSAGQCEFGNKKFVRGHPELFAEMHTKSVMDSFYARSKARKAKAQVEDRLHELTI
uniref:Heat stress transcription factor A-1e n=2 Tax=Noccaea caerulescens TaxID=107243 RepID=A0A1J3IHP8_NOCCA